MENSSVDGRQRRKKASVIRYSIRKAFAASHKGKKYKKKTIIDDNELLDEEEEEQEQEEADADFSDDPKRRDNVKRNVDSAPYYIEKPSTVDASARFAEGTLVCILQTADVEQRVPHTIHKIGIIEQAPQHPNTWFKVRIRDGDVVYKYRPSALKVISEYESTRYESERLCGKAEADVFKDTEGDDEDKRAWHDSICTYETMNELDKEGEQVGGNGDKELYAGMHVRIQLRNLSRRERDYLKYNGKCGMIQEASSGACKVRMMDDKERVLTLKKRHLKVCNGRMCYPQTSEYQEDMNESEKDSDVDESCLLSSLDPEMWVDRKCRINVGKFKGCCGQVLRSGNGWVQLRLDSSNGNTAKRAYELTILEDVDDVKRSYTKCKVQRTQQSCTIEDEEEDELNTEEEDSRIRGDMDDEGSNRQTDESQDEDSNGAKRTPRCTTRGSYGISWIDRKVQLPSRKGIGTVKKVDRDACIVEIEGSRVLQAFKKKDLKPLGDDSTRGCALSQRALSRSRHNGKMRERFIVPQGMVLMGTTPNRYIAFQDLVKRFVMRRRERFKDRPNLIEWQARINLTAVVNADKDQADMTIPNLEPVPLCIICGCERESKDGACWNLKCPRSPLFDVDNYDTLTGDDFARLPLIGQPNLLKSMSLDNNGNSPQKRARF